MRLIELWQRVMSSSRLRRLEQDLDDELAFHIAMQQADAAAAGGSAVEASREARRQFGNVTAIKEQMRLIAALLFGVGSIDIPSGVGVAVLAMAALSACLAPAVRATRVDPLHALRHDQWTVPSESRQAAPLSRSAELIETRR